MGDSRSDYYDKLDYYKWLCEKYHEKEDKIYSNHHKWLEDKHYNRTTLSFVEYDYNENLRVINRKIESKKEELSNLKKEKKDIIKKYEKIQTNK